MRWLRRPQGRHVDTDAGAQARRLRKLIQHQQAEVDRLTEKLSDPDAVDAFTNAFEHALRGDG